MKTLFNSIQVSKNHFIDTIENMIKNGDEIVLPLPSCSMSGWSGNL